MSLLPSSASRRLATIRAPRLRPLAPDSSPSRTSLQIAPSRPVHPAQFVALSVRPLLLPVPAGFQTLPPSCDGALAFLPVRVRALPAAFCARRFEQHWLLSGFAWPDGLRSAGGGDSKPQDIPRYTL